MLAVVTGTAERVAAVSVLAVLASVEEACDSGGNAGVGVAVRNKSWWRERSIELTVSTARPLCAALTGWLRLLTISTAYVERCGRMHRASMRAWPAAVVFFVKALPSLADERCIQQLCQTRGGRKTAKLRKRLVSATRCEMREKPSDNRHGVDAR
ncbi:hypothetical protein BD414DRAFT_488398 [Trametes punicea]|nr:hypothetical protein BD414DRAFT_488398 [Trametes punicea]